MSANCIGDAATCVFTDDPVSPDGFCSATGCQNPAIDCAPAPTDATSPAVCINVVDANGNNVPVCALDCSLGQTQLRHRPLRSFIAVNPSRQIIVRGPPLVPRRSPTTR
jgi:hypothetical protein